SFSVGFKFFRKIGRMVCGFFQKPTVSACEYHRSRRSTFGIWSIGIIEKYPFPCYFVECRRINPIAAIDSEMFPRGVIGYRKEDVWSFYRFLAKTLTEKEKANKEWGYFLHRLEFISGHVIYLNHV